MTAGPRVRAGFRLAPDDGICNGAVVRFQNKKVFSVFRTSDKRIAHRFGHVTLPFSLPCKGFLYF